MFWPLAFHSFRQWSFLVSTRSGCCQISLPGYLPDIFRHQSPTPSQVLGSGGSDFAQWSCPTSPPHTSVRHVFVHVFKAARYLLLFIWSLVPRLNRLMIPLTRNYPLGDQNCVPNTSQSWINLWWFATVSPAKLWFYDVEAREPTVKAARADMAPMGSVDPGENVKGDHAKNRHITRDVRTFKCLQFLAWLMVCICLHHFAT